MLCGDKPERCKGAERRERDGERAKEIRGGIPSGPSAAGTGLSAGGLGMNKGARIVMQGNSKRA